MLLTALLFAAAIAEANWPAIVACPTVSVPNTASGTGVIIGTKDGYAYLLTAAHVIGDIDAVGIAVSSRNTFPRPSWFATEVKVLERWLDPDLALIRFRPFEGQSVAVLPLAPAWERPKAFPTGGRSIGMEAGPAAARSESIRARDFITRDGKQPAFFWRTIAPPERGRSGGPLLDDRGHVIGIAVAAAGERGYYAHHDEIVAALKRAGHGWLVPAR